MGKIITTGYAERTVEYDRMTVTLTFRSRERYTKDALYTVSSECEELLEKLQELGVDISAIRGEADSLSQNTYNDSVINVNASRTITWDAELDLKEIDILTQMIEKGSYSVDLNIEPSYSQIDELSKDLMKEAALDAKKTADLLAASLGSKVKGPAKISANSYSSRNVVYEGMLLDMPDFAGRGYKETAYSTLKSPTTTEDADITIEWELED